MMNIATNKNDDIIRNIDSYLNKYKFRNKGEYFRYRIFYHPMDNMYVYIEKKESGVILKLFVSSALYKYQISRRFSWITLGMYSATISKMCREINSLILEIDASAQIQIEDKKEWCPVIILK